MQDISAQTIPNVNSETRVLITGAAGFIGANAVDYYAKRGYKVMATDIRKPAVNSLPGPFISTDLLNRESLVREFSQFNPDFILHLGARTDVFERHSINGYAANIEGVANVLAAANACSRLKRVIMTSSRLVCPVGYIQKHEEDYCPPNFYGASKVETERITRTTPLKAEWVIIRPVGIWGPGFLVPSYRDFFEQLRRGRYFHVTGHSPKKTFGYVKNFTFQTEKIFQAASSKVASKTFYISDYDPVDLRTWADLIARDFGHRPVRSIPYPLLKIVASVGDLCKIFGWANVPLSSIRLRNLIADAVHDLSALEAVTGPLPYDLATATKETVEWLKANP